MRYRQVPPSPPVDLLAEEGDNVLDSSTAEEIEPSAHARTRVRWHTPRTAEIVVGGEIDLLSVRRLSATLDLVQRLGAGNILVNLDEVTFLGVVGVHALAEAAAQTHLRVTRCSREAGRTLALADPDATVPRPASIVPELGRRVPGPRTP